MMQWLDFFFLPSSGDGWLSQLVPGDKESRTHCILVVGMDNRGAREERIVKWGKEKRIHGEFHRRRRLQSGVRRKKTESEGLPNWPSDLIEIRNLCT